MSDDLLVSREAKVTMMDMVSTLMEHSFQGGKQTSEQCRIRQDNMIKSDWAVATLDRALGKAFHKKEAFEPRSE